jgi:hypothetical protein
MLKARGLILDENTRMFSARDAFKFSPHIIKIILKT